MLIAFRNFGEIKINYTSWDYDYETFSEYQIKRKIFLYSLKFLLATYPP